jgi:hypothetical protein
MMNAVKKNADVEGLLIFKSIRQQEPREINEGVYDDSSAMNFT